MTDEGSRSAATPLTVDRREQFPFEEVEETITALVQAAAAHRESGWGQIAHAPTRPAEVLDGWSTTTPVPPSRRK